MQLLGPVPTPSSDCERILRSLPQWFGIEQALMEYVQDSERNPTFVATVGEPIAFLTVRSHFLHSWEVHCMAVEADQRGRGVGRLLHQHVEGWLRDQGARLLQVKTLAASHPSAAYAQTRKFYQAMGYTELEVFPTLWSPTLPVLQLVKPLAGGSAA